MPVATITAGSNTTLIPETENKEGNDYVYKGSLTAQREKKAFEEGLRAALNVTNSIMITMRSKGYDLVKELKEYEELNKWTVGKNIKKYLFTDNGFLIRIWKKK